jgi:hypothetical protein
LQGIEPPDEVDQQVPVVVKEVGVLWDRVKIEIVPGGFGPVFEEISLEIESLQAPPILVLRHDPVPRIADECKLEVIPELSLGYVPTGQVLGCGQVVQDVWTESWIIVRAMRAIIV